MESPGRSGRRQKSKGGLAYDEHSAPAEQPIVKNPKRDWPTYVGRESVLHDEHPERRRRPRMGILHRRSNPEDHL
ncbi:hypothetical protein PUN28_018293 [Cardiocondyla obscurior]|uniref:Uncharacterized protein n=1 Tax=Cardiocondyla obscurior TaxID=286306 RepID=A0AAW2EKX4_9HYME